MSSSNCCFLTCIQVSQEAGQVVWYSHVFQNFPKFIVIHTVKGFGIVNKAEIDVFLELSCFFNDPEDIGNLISGSSAFSKTSLNIWKFTVHVLLKPSLENFEHSILSYVLNLSSLTLATLWNVAHQTPLSMGIPQTRILEWVARPSSRGSSWPRDQTHISWISGGFFYCCATREAPDWSWTAGKKLRVRRSVG